MTARDRFRPGDDTGSLAMALLLTLVGVTLSALLAPMVLTQIGSTRTTMQRTDALNAAQAGIDAALGQIRAAKGSDGTGLIQKLPCHVSAPTVGAGSTAAFDVAVTYLAIDPRGKPDTWLGDPSNQIKCAEGSGTKSAPAYAVLQSTGTAGKAHRVLRSTYRFRVTNQPMSGGLIYVDGTGMCLDAGSATPVAGTTLVLQPCSPDSPQQRFAYGKNLNLYLAATRVPGGDLGMCLDAAKNNTPIQFQPCVSPTQPQQQWNLNDNSTFQGTKDGSKLSNFCFSATGTNPGSPVELRPCPQATSLSPEASAGAGAAGASSQQLVNLGQFGRCMDVTDFDVNEGFLIVWPCKQAPNPADIGWNQRWALPTIGSGAKSASGPIITTDDRGRRYCLRSPGTTAAFQYVTVALCPANLASAPQWTVYGDTGDDLTSYHIRDGSGYCLSPTDPNATPPDLFSKGYEISKIVVADCNRSTPQRWNSPPLNAGVEDLREK